MDESESDVLIIGGGVIGLACAYYLLRAGRSVRLIERGRVGAATSHGNCGTLTPSHAPPLAAPGTIGKALRWMLQPDAPLYIKPRLDLPLALWLLRFAGRCNAADWQRTASAKGALLQASRQLIDGLVRDNQLDCEFAASGLSYVYRTTQALERDLAQLPGLAQFGVESQLLQGPALQAHEPALLPGLAGAIHFPGDAQLRPDRFTRELARTVLELGGIIEENLEAGSLVVSSDVVEGVRTAAGIRRGRDILVACGPWSPQVLAAIGLHLPIQPGKGYSITYSRPELAPRTALVLRERSVCVTAWQSGFRLGSTMEFSGFDDSLNRLRLDALERGAAEYLQQPVGPEKREEWFGWRPMTHDDLPILGRAPGLRNLWLATGHGMMGMGMSAGTGQLMADLITGRAPLLDPAPYLPERFA